MYNVLASSSIGHHQFSEEASTPDPREYLVQPLAREHLPNEAGGFHPQVFSFCLLASQLNSPHHVAVHADLPWTVHQHVP
jgi:hypothetical protein